MDEPSLLPDAFAVRVHWHGSTVLVVVRGELDLLTAPELQRVLDDVLEQDARHVVLDLRELEFIDSTGVQVVYRLDRLARQDGFNAAIVRGDASVHRVFTISGLDEQLLFVDGPDELAPPQAGD